MLPNHAGHLDHTGSCTLVNVTITYDKSNSCDIDAVDDEDTNNNDVLDEQAYHNATHFQVTPGEKTFGTPISNGVSLKMTIPKSTESLAVRRPSAISLKPIVTANLDTEDTDGCFGDRHDSDRHECGQGINIKFQDLIYRARRGFSWDRCKCKLSFLILHTHFNDVMALITQ